VAQIEKLLATHPELTRLPVKAEESGIDSAWLTTDGDVRTLPYHTPRPLDDSVVNLTPGMDGFFIARLTTR
jgi:16S rRNA (cytosine967-C5)-methyltransferase